MFKDFKILNTLVRVDKEIKANIKSMFHPIILNQFIKIDVPGQELLEYPIMDTDEMYIAYKGKPVHEVFLRSFYGANQQFCFWFNRLRSDDRCNYTSGSINDLIRVGNIDEVSKNLSDHIIKDAVTLRKERLGILKSSIDYSYWIKDTEDILDFDGILSYLYNFPNFHDDLFRKKANFFIMDIIRYYKLVKKDKNFFDGVVVNHLVYWESFSNFMEKIIEKSMPAIDYQIPKALRNIGILDFTEDFEKKMESGIEFVEDSTEELFIRSCSYLALVKLKEKYRHQSGITHEELDGNLFFNRKSFTNKIHLCRTTKY